MTHSALPPHGGNLAAVFKIAGIGDFTIQDNHQAIRLAMTMNGATLPRSPAHHQNFHMFGLKHQMAGVVVFLKLFQGFQL